MYIRYCLTEKFFIWSKLWQNLMKMLSEKLHTTIGRMPAVLKAKMNISGLWQLSNSARNALLLLVAQKNLAQNLPLLRKKLLPRKLLRSNFFIACSMMKNPLKREDFLLPKKSKKYIKKLLFLGHNYPTVDLIFSLITQARTVEFFNKKSLSFERVFDVFSVMQKTPRLVQKIVVFVL